MIEEDLEKCDSVRTPQQLQLFDAFSTSSLEGTSSDGYYRSEQNSRSKQSSITRHRSHRSHRPLQKSTSAGNLQVKSSKALESLRIEGGLDLTVKEQVSPRAFFGQ
jgi:hypothetical protein